MDQERFIQMLMPDVFWDMSELERYKEGIQTTSDFCCGCGKYYLYGIVEAPIENCEEPFRWGLWFEVSKEDHDRYLNAFQTDAVDNLTLEGKLANLLPCYGEDNGTLVRMTCYKTRRPSVDVLGNSPMAEDQKTGYTMEDVATLNQIFFGEEAFDGEE